MSKRDFWEEVVAELNVVMRLGVSLEKGAGNMNWSGGRVDSRAFRKLRCK